MPRNPNPEGKDLVGDAVRRSAAQVAFGARRLAEAMAAPLYRPRFLTAPVRADLTDALHRIAAVLDLGPRELCPRCGGPVAAVSETDQADDAA